MKRLRRSHHHQLHRDGTDGRDGEEREPLPAFLDGLGAGMGYAIVLFIVATIRELFGFGQLFGKQIIPLSWYASPDNPNGYENFVLMVSPPAAFFLIGGLIYLSNKLHKRS